MQRRATNDHPHRLSGTRWLIAALTGLAVCACASEPSYTPPDNIEQRVTELMDEFNAATVGIGIIRDGELVWTGYYGEESPGVPASAQSLFNTASVNKSITAEVALRLASKGLIDLDEPISEHYIHPDIAGDPRHEKLTPRILLTHQAGFLNWPFLYEDGKLAFIDEPANGNYHYAGIGFRIFARFLEEKLGQPFPDIVRAHVFDPVGMANTTNSHDIAKTLEHVVRPVDPSGAFVEEHEFETDYWSAADDLFVTVEDYAAFLIAVMDNDDVSETFASERSKVATLMADNEIWGCGEDAVDPCPSPYGHGIGWFVFGYEDGITVHHGGNDRSEGAIGYYQPNTRNGGIVFINSAQGVQMWPKAVDLVDPDQKFQDVFHDLIAKFFSGD
ncbi:MAG: serine hydrolase domain-containing protein [Pseudomonadota bacterium]